MTCPVRALLPPRLPISVVIERSSRWTALPLRQTEQKQRTAKSAERLPLTPILPPSSRDLLGPVGGTYREPDPPLEQKEKSPGEGPGLYIARKNWRLSSEAGSVGTVTATVARTAVGRAAVTEPIVETNFQHLNFAVRPESVSQERSRPKRYVVQVKKVILELGRPICR